MSSFIDFAKAVTMAAKESLLKSKSERLANVIETLDVNDPQRTLVINEREAIEAQRVAINSKVKKLHESIDPTSPQNREERERREQNPDLYVRPASFMNEKLGPLPVEAKILTPTADDMRQIESHNALLATVCLSAYIGFLILGAAAPWFVRGINSLWSKPTTVNDPAEFGLIHVITIVYVLLLTVFRKQIDKMLYRSSIGSEQRWRMGSEQWTWPQRANSYLAEMLSQVFYLLFFPLVTVVFFWLPIPVLSKLYLDTYARTGDAEYATLTSAKFSARLWKYLLLTILVAGSLPWVMDIVL